VFLGKGSSKTPLKYFCKKSMSKTFPKQIDKNFDVSFSSIFFVLSRFRVRVSQRWEFKNTTKNVLQKNRVEKFLQNIRPKIQNRFFSQFFLSRFWAFLGDGSSKTRLKKYRKNKSDPIPFSYSDPPTHHGGPRLLIFLPAPWFVLP
jgi:hypothetical protein